VRNAVARMLQRLGYTVLSAADGVDGLAVVRAQHGRIHAVLLDMTMPHMTTEDIVRSLGQLEPRPHVVLMSGYSEQEIEGRFAPQDIAAFLHKPFTLSQLRDTLARVLTSS
jgi:two-component system, cell cycle sensor histidine kinase and response regulator CckA